MFDDVTLHYVDSVDDARDFVAWAAGLANRRASLAVDTETTGLKWWTAHFVRLVQFGTATEAWALDVERWRGAIEQALTMIVDAECPVIMHNCAFDMHALEADGFPFPHWRNVHDTMFMSHLLAPHESHSLKPLGGRLFGNAAFYGQGALKALFKRTGTDWATVDTREPDYWVYGNMDTVLTYKAAELLTQELRTHGMTELYQREMAVREILYRAEKRGLLVDPEWTSTLRHQWTLEAVNLAATLEGAGIKNPLSNLQVTAVLEQLEWEPDEWTPSGAVKLDKVILNQLAAERPEWAHVAEPLLRYRRITKWISSYLDPFLTERDANDRIHMSIRSMQARTGRMSITEPAMQTLPSRDDGAWMIRRAIKASPGHSIFAVDYNSQEARTFAHYSQDPGMIAAINRGDDLYRYAAEVIYSDPSITKADHRRSMTKVNMLAFTYGAGVEKLSKTSGLSYAETEAFVRRLFDVFPNVRNLTGDHAIGGDYPGAPAIAAAHRGQDEGLRYVLTKSGRRFSVPNDFELYKCVNGLCQGSGADVLKDAIVRLDQLGFGDNIILPVHDELLFEFPDGEEGALMAREAATSMEDRSLSVPLTTEMTGPFETWGHHYMPEDAE